MRSAKTLIDLCTIERWFVDATHNALARFYIATQTTAAAAAHCARVSGNNPAAPITLVALFEIFKCFVTE
jgi:hypothetical protein